MKKTYPSKAQEQQWIDAYRSTKDKNAIEHLYYEIAYPVIKYTIWQYKIPVQHIKDLEQECFLAVVKAINKFNSSRARFITYVALWIRACVFNYIQKNSMIVKIFTNDSKDRIFYNLKKTIDQIEKDGYVVTTLEIATRLNVSESDVIDCMCFSQVSFDQKIDDNNNNYYSIIAAEECSPEYNAIMNEQIELLQETIPIIHNNATMLEKQILSAFIEGRQYTNICKKNNLSDKECKEIEKELIDRIISYIYN